MRRWEVNAELLLQQIGAEESVVRELGFEGLGQLDQPSSAFSGLRLLFRKSRNIAFMQKVEPARKKG